jgi:hypothetical protein
MTKEDWARIEKALGGIYGYAKLQVDGREVTFQRQLVSKNSLGVITYVDGHMKGVWLSPREEYPERRYMRPFSRYIYPAKQREKIKKMPKWMKKDLRIDPDEKIQLFSSIWPSATAIRRHYQKTFTSIELIEEVG